MQDIINASTFGIKILFSLIIILHILPAYSDENSSNEPQCEPTGKYKLLHFESCYKYYSCDNGTLSENRCFPYLRRFNNATQECEWFWKTPCETSPPMPTSNMTLPVCSPKDTYSILYPGNCKKYYFCNQGILTVRSCNLFQKYDSSDKKCKLFLRFKCAEQQLHPPKQP